MITQKTVFGVTDIYFLAGYFGLMEVVEDEIHRLTYQCAHTKKGAKIPCEVILKAVGTKPDFATDKMLGLRELVGLWSNGDPRRPVACNGMFVEARNFGSFSSGPAFAGIVVAINYFIDFPDDLDLIRSALPWNKAKERPAYVPDARHLGATFPQFSTIPALAAEIGKVDPLKATKTQKGLPISLYVEACRREWEGYIKIFRQRGMVDDRPDPPYPYTEEMVHDWIARTQQYWMEYAEKRS